MILKNCSTTLFFLFFAFPLFSQDTDFIIGKLVEANSPKPIPYATIQLKEKSIGVISNASGEFRIPNRHLDLETILVFSCLGYESLEMTISSLSTEEINIISLKEKTIQLNETIVFANKKKKNGAKKVVKKAIKAIPTNYAIQPFSLIGYYRDYQFENMTYVNLNEAILEVFDMGFENIDSLTTKVKLYEQKINKNFKSDSLSRQIYNYKTKQKTIKNAFLNAYGGNEFTILRIHDAIRNYKVGSYSFVNVMKTDFVIYHSFSFLPSIYIGEEPLYVIAFKRKQSNFKVRGKLYISQKDFSIHKMEYALYDDTKILKNKKRSLGVREKDVLDEKLIFKVITEYRRVNTKMYLNYISFQNTFELLIPSVFTIKNVSVNISKKCLEINFSDQPEPKSALLKEAYRIYYKKKKLNFKSMDLDPKRNAVLLFPDLTQEKLEEMMESFIKASKQENDELSQLLKVKVKNIYSSGGDLINETKIKSYYQFREFFVQKVNSNRKAPIKGQFMDLGKPIYKNNISKASVNSNYWMNTPLKHY